MEEGTALGTVDRTSHGILEGISDRMTLGIKVCKAEGMTNGRFKGRELGIMVGTVKGTVERKVEGATEGRYNGREVGMS